MALLNGYTKTGKPVEIDLIDGRVIITYTMTGRKVRWNQEQYTERDIPDIKFWLTSEGYRIF